MGLAAQQVHAQAPAAAASAALGSPPLDDAAIASRPPAIAASPGAATPAPTPLTEPGLVGVETINGADTGWMMTSTALVLLMTLPGIALFYGGMVRRKSVLNVMACVVATCAIVSLLWFAVGYSIAFTPGSGVLGHVLGGTGRLWFSGLDYIKDAQKVAVSH
ncbi:MAG: ammonium transporter, partial [Polaromonas sp.]|nr:ammonium transporter [Polaromonas sp.]